MSADNNHHGYFGCYLWVVKQLVIIRVVLVVYGVYVVHLFGRVNIVHLFC